MFGASGFGVALTAAAVPPWTTSPEPEPPALPADHRPARLGELLPVGGRADTELADELQRVVRLEARLAAYKAELVVAFAAHRPDRLDVPRGRPQPRDDEPSGSEGTSEFFADELALVVNSSRTAATTLLGQSITLLTRLPATWAALADGELDWPRARALAAELGTGAAGTDPRIIGEIEAALLATAGELSVRQLRASARALLIQRDAAAAERRRASAEKSADVTLRRRPDGMAEFTAFLPAALAAALQQTVDGYARTAKADGDARPLGQLRVGVLSDLVLRPWDTTREPFTAHLTVHMTVPPAPSSSSRTCTSAEVDGHPITGAQLRVLLEQLDSMCPGGLRVPASGSLHIALTDPGSGALRAVVSDRELRRLADRGCPDHPGDDDCGCGLLDRPPPVDRYRPSEAQRRFSTTRDRTCRHPGCSNRAGWADLDHVVPHARGGSTDCSNLCCLCRRHHRLKTDAPHWSFSMTADGELTVTTPSGITRVTRPPGMTPASSAASPEEDPPPF